MKQEIPQPTIIGAAAVVVVLLIGLIVFLNRPETIPEGKIDPNLPPPTVNAGSNSRYMPVQDNRGQQQPTRTPRFSNKQD